MVLRKIYKTIYLQKLSTALVNSAFSFLQQVLQQEPQARAQLLQMLQPEISVSAREENTNRQPATAKELCRKIDAKKHWTKKDFQDAFSNHLNFKKFPATLQHHYNYKLSKMQ